MTEEEARTKWCPFAMGAPRQSTTPGINRYEDGSQAQGTFCIGSACMAWRATEPVTLKRIDREGVVHVATGYCGLAGGQP